MKFSVLMSLYIKEKPDYADMCFKSLLRQTVQADEWVIVEDGPLTQEMYALLDDYERAHPGLIRRVRLDENQGLGPALRRGVPECANALIARMDTDDIAREDRFERQLAAFAENPELDICGSHIAEFEDDPSVIVAQRRVPLTDAEIKAYQKRRDAFNHMTVMYRKAAVLSAGNYRDCPLMEDTLLWVNMMKNGAVCRNIDEALVFARIGRGMYERRGGWRYFLKYREGRRRVLETGYIGKGDYLYTVAVQLAVALMPSRLRGWVYKRKLHSGGQEGRA